jgi:EAL domain-containing protein (putative c-di-GMP-specific phosphodiesterase class I)
LKFQFVDDPLDDIATRCFVDVARVLGVRTVAEHAETLAALERVRDIGFDSARGFLLHRPEPVEALLRQCATQASVDVDPPAVAIQGSATGG